MGAHSVLERQRGKIHYQTEGYMLYSYTDDAVGAMSRGHLLPCVAEGGSAQGWPQGWDDALPWVFHNKNVFFRQRKEGTVFQAV